MQQAQSLIGQVNTDPDPRTAAPSVADAAHALLRLGRLMLVNGAATEAVQAKVSGLGHRLGYQINLLIFAEGLLLTVQDRHGFQTKLGPRISATGVNIGALKKLDEAADEGGSGPLNIGAIERQLDRIEFAPERYPLWLMALGMALSAGSLAWVFGGALPAIGAAALAGIVNVVLREQLESRAVNPIAMAAVIALISGFVASLVMKLFPGHSSFVCLIAAGTILIPGVLLINGMRETLSSQVGAGLPQLVLALATILAVVFGLLLAANLTGDVMGMAAHPGRPRIDEVILFSGLAGMGFVVIFNAPLRVAWVCLACAALGHGIRSGLMHVDVSLAMASLGGALAAAVLARIFADHYRMPAVTFTFPGIVTLLPAPEAFRAVLGGLEIMRAGAEAPASLVAATLALAITTLLVVAGIAIGLSVVLAIPRRHAVLFVGGGRT